MINFKDLTNIKELKPGLHVRSKYSNEIFMVIANYGTYAIAVKSQHVSNPDEWEVEENVNEMPRLR